MALRAEMETDTEGPAGAGVKQTQAGGQGGLGWKSGAGLARLPRGASLHGRKWGVSSRDFNRAQGLVIYINSFKGKAGSSSTQTVLPCIGKAV